VGEEREGVGLLERAGLHKVGLLKGLQSIATIRNASILAHGSTPIPAGDLSRLARNAHPAAPLMALKPPPSPPVEARTRAPAR